MIVFVKNSTILISSSAPAPQLATWLAELAGGRPLLVAGSTVPGEERLVLDAFELAREQTGALLLVAPRHPERFGEVWAEIVARHPEAVRRSAPRAASAQPSVALLDTLGELAAAYEQAVAAFIGGSLVRRGGHNPLEAARFGVPVGVGPSMENFREMADAFEHAGAWARVRSARELGELWRRWLLDRVGARAVGQRGHDLVAANCGALERTLALLDAHLPGAPGPEITG